VTVSVTVPVTVTVTVQSPQESGEDNIYL
jgi:hypothetical protein